MQICQSQRAPAVCARLQHKWPERITDLLGVQVLSGDGLLQHICQKCECRVEMLERAATDLVAFHEHLQPDDCIQGLPEAPQGSWSSMCLARYC